MTHLTTTRLCLTFILAMSMAASLHARDEVELKPLAQDLKEAIIGDETLLDGDHLMELDAPYRAMDAAIVPISVSMKKNQSEDFYIKNLMIVIDENPSPLAAIFGMSPDNGSANLDTRIRIDRYTHVRAIAEDNHGKLYTVSKFVKAAGGCSAPALSDMADAQKRLGKMKFKFKEVNADGVRKGQLLISHPNYSGLQFNQLTRREIPSHYVDSVEIRSGERILFRAESGISISENPAFTFSYYDLTGNDPITVKVTDSEGMVFEQQWQPEDQNMSKKTDDTSPARS